MIFSAGHNVQRNPGAGLLYNVHQIVDQTFKDIQRSGDSDVKHSFRFVEAETGSLAACEKNGACFLRAQSFQTDRLKLIMALFNFREFHRAEGFDLFSGLFVGGRLLTCHMDQVPVDCVDLLQQGRLPSGVSSL